LELQKFELDWDSLNRYNMYDMGYRKTNCSNTIDSSW